MHVSTTPRVMVITSTNPPTVSKHFSLDDGGGLHKRTAGNISEGSYEVFNVLGLHEMKTLLQSLTPDQAIVFGTPQHDAGRLTTVADLKRQTAPTTIARCNRCLIFNDGPGWMLIDYDPPEGEEALDIQGLVGASSSMVPNLIRAGAVASLSASSNIVRTADGTDLTGNRGIHLYIPVSNASQIPEAAEALQLRAWEAGYGRIEISRAGSLLERGLVDQSVSQPAKLDFAAGAVCGDGLEQRRGEPVIIPPTSKDQTLDLKKYVKRPRNVVDIRRKISAAKTDKSQAAQKVRDAYVIQRAAKEAKRLYGDNASAADIDKVKRRIEALYASTRLPPDFILTVVVDGEQTDISVDDVLEDPDSYHGGICLDPLEPDYDGGRAVAVIYTDEMPQVFSQAHGGRVFQLSRVDAAAVPEAFYDTQKKSFWIAAARGTWIPVNEKQYIRELKAAGVSAVKDPITDVSPVDDAILRTQRERNVSYAGPLAGHKAGLHVAQEGQILVTTSPRIIEPEPGEWPTLKTLLMNLFGPQMGLVLLWLKVSYEALRSHRQREGQALVMCGPAGCGKSLVQQVITSILGGRSASPYQFMTGGTAFNSDCFGAEHLTIEDETPSTDIRSRRAFGSSIKSFVANRGQRLHAKNCDALTVNPFWRLSVSLNDEPENLMILPPMDESIADKVMLFKVAKQPMPMPTNTLNEQERFMATLKSEIPALLHDLLATEIPAGLTSSRYGVTHYHDPEILEALANVAPEMRLLELIDIELLAPAAMLVNSRTFLKLSAIDVERKLCDAESRCQHEARQLLSHWNGACGTYMARLAKSCPDRVQRGARQHRGGDLWHLYPAKADFRDKWGVIGATE